MRYRLKIRYAILGILLFITWATQLIPLWGNVYAQSVYPVISYCLSSFHVLSPLRQETCSSFSVSLESSSILSMPVATGKELETYSVE